MLKNFLADDSIVNKSTKAIYEYIYQYGPITQAKLCEMTKLKRLKVARILDELLKKTYIEKAGYGKPSGGRPPLIYQVNARSGFIISVHITRISTRITLFDLFLNPLNETTFSMTKKHTPTVVLTNINATIQTFMKNHHFTSDELLGVGIATVGPLDGTTGVILNPEHFLASGWKNVPIVKMIQETHQVNVLLENATSMTALGEYKYLHNSHKNILHCFNSWVFVCGIITDGKIVKPEYGNATSYGHMVINPNGKTCSCGSRGCVSTYSTLQAILNNLKDNQPDLYNDLKDHEEFISIEEIIKRLVNKEQAQDVIKESAYYFGIGVANLINIFQSSAVVLGGPLVQSMPHYYEEAIQTAKQFIAYNKEVTFSKQRDTSAVEGVAIAVLYSFMSSDLSENSFFKKSSC
ncbi:ROK family transcriptional regulator [Salipaludibacillus sp. CF4.18]|uniref:ROK family transcriptional regulator n=1 Tax=Salipaludibacillus sp. CF4.18 TaxID=3373081 RepID=UPI003EE4614A